jgi:hypothetical protein
MGRYLGILEGLVEGYGGHSKRAPASPEKEAVKGVDNGVEPLLPHPKRLRMGSPAKLPPQKTPHFTLLYEGRCYCSCSKQSTCQRGCDCRKSKRQCRNCDCFGQCRNKLDYRAALCRSTHDIIPGNDDSPGPVAIMTNITLQSIQTDDKPTSPSEPQRLVLEEKSKECSPPAEPTEGEDKPHEREDICSRIPPFG